jgi:hypothetical protein
MRVTQLMSLPRAPLLPHHLDGFITLRRIAMSQLMWSEKRQFGCTLGPLSRTRETFGSDSSLPVMQRARFHFTLA